LQFNRDCTPHAANKLQASWRSRPSGAVAEEDRWRYLLIVTTLSALVNFKTQICLCVCAHPDAHTEYAPYLCAS